MSHTGQLLADSTIFLWPLAVLLGSLRGLRLAESGVSSLHEAAFRRPELIHVRQVAQVAGPILVGWAVVAVGSVWLTMRISDFGSAPVFHLATTAVSLVFVCALGYALTSRWPQRWLAGLTFVLSFILPFQSIGVSRWTYWSNLVMADQLNLGTGVPDPNVLFARTVLFFLGTCFAIVLASKNDLRVGAVILGAATACAIFLVNSEPAQDDPASSETICSTREPVICTIAMRKHLLPKAQLLVDELDQLFDGGLRRFTFLDVAGLRGRVDFSQDVRPLYLMRNHFAKYNDFERDDSIIATFTTMLNNYNECIFLEVADWRNGETPKLTERGNAFATLRDSFGIVQPPAYNNPIPEDAVRQEVSVERILKLLEEPHISCVGHQQ